MALILVIFVFWFNLVSAETPDAIKQILKKEHPKIKFRFDGMFEVNNKLWLLTKAKNSSLRFCKEDLDLVLKEESCSEISDQISLVQKTDKDDYLFSNLWIYTPVENNSIKSFDYYPKIFQDVLIQSQINQNFLVPKDFVLPRDLAMLAGRLPVALGSVELATDREILYKKRVKEEEKNKAFEFLTYSFHDGSFNSIKIHHKDDESLAMVEIKPEKGLSEIINYASKIKKINDEIFISDQTQGKIFKLVKSGSESASFDATKPLENNFESKKNLEDAYRLDLVFDIKNYFKENNGIKDFSFNKGRTNYYILSAIDSTLHIINSKDKVLIKSISLPASVDGMKIVSRSISEPDKLVFRSRSGSKIFIVNTFDYRVSSILELEQVSDVYNFIPNDLLVTEDHILIATQALYKSPKKEKDVVGKILALDPITGSLISSIDMSFIPYHLDFSSTKNEIFALGSNFEAKTKISKIDTKELKLIKTEDLSPDIIDSKSFTVSGAGKFILIPSEASSQVGVLDIETCSLVKKLDLGTSTSYILAL